ncbi:MAG: ATP-binding protein [Streptomyces sp.]
MTHHYRASVTTDPANVPAVRHTLAKLLAEWGLPETTPTAQLVLSELLGNAIRYGGGPTVTVDVARETTALRIAVSDNCAIALPRLRHPSEDEEHGRGLALVNALTTDWGTDPTTTGKTVWALLPTAAPAAR